MVARTWRYAAGLALLGALAGGLVGCTSSPAGPGSTSGPTGGATSVPATSTATSPSSGTATGSATGTLAYPADVPAEARVNSPAGAMAFARHFFAQVNKAYTTPQAGLIAPLSTANCKSCAAYEKHAADYVGRAVRYDRPAIVVQEITVSPETEPGATLLLDIVVEQQAARLIDAGSRVAESFEHARGIVVLHVVRSNEAWLAREVQVRS